MPTLSKKNTIYLLAALAVLIGMMHGEPMWTKVSSTFIKEDKPYGPGDFRIRGDRVISMKLTEPIVTFKPMEERSRPDVAEPTEAWMSDVKESANRRSVRILAGALDNPLRTFEERAQKADWWLAPDWSTAYLATGWMDYHDEPKPSERNTPQLTKLFKSTNQGQDWQQLEWPEHQDITFLRFLDPQRGYLIGWGPRIWRTTDGGANWTEIPVPEQARDPQDERAEFDLVALGKDGTLRLAFLVRDDTGYHSQIHVLRWGENTPKLALRLPEQTVTDMADDGSNRLYILSQTGLPSYLAGPDAAPRLSQVSIQRTNGVDVLQTFDKSVTGYALYTTPSQALLFDGVDESGLRPRDLTALSLDGGRTWKQEDEGSSAQGGYYDTQTGTRWRVSSYSLYKRMIQ
ncbi:WD40/YVTN/BNR-like repeat-containing protein [Alcaligenes sp. SDU_A2]|uniref:WD40/YVTN/BNR-like repeat-containing protein n=1 Tax=Alcaligenes sp. SDU_A2 TaxID=3136634 RepID=UPI00311F2BC8